MMSLGVTEIFAEMVAVLPDVLLTMAFSPVGTALPDQLPAVFQSVLVDPSHVPLFTRLAVTTRRVVLSQPLTVCVA